ncbi:hypothetical protein CAOG_07709 [Capsaspora owczarzaki ATCC 30864]|uniref:Integrator complex subunit 7 n=1 Tax=Capsaspora owczarzaki (strain ATCC 30864) TaxID=595528 RepID=A0A0D2WX24_CAPO3|nr:hypothetical protein CAOG_07709 [Capsaspora owczarzaki ATCC 30864]KJE97273.1 hypothetical protein CAOG_007709 [Capsaspora owczarzaki ATCC 30864]|eukprot:XP_004343583.2 hypothetical protein CAOG_07709 [Capsaspora owczarzaki ATCC 30864]
MSGRSVDVDEANRQLLELDKGLRATDLGEQCEAIVGVARVLEKYPLPVIVNSALLKLADEFRSKNNLIRGHVAGVLSQCSAQLNRVINVDELVMRIFIVSHSNDSVARSLALTALGALALIAKDKKTVHNAVLNALSATDEIEVDAAIGAAARFCSVSSEFASALCTRIGPMCRGHDTPPLVKLRLLQLLALMHHSAQLCKEARETLVELLVVAPTRPFTAAILSTLTRLVLASQDGLSEQVGLLIQFVQIDPRDAVRCAALDGLALLAQQIPYDEAMWASEGCLDALTELVSDASPSVAVRAVVVLRALARPRWPLCAAFHALLASSNPSKQTEAAAMQMDTDSASARAVVSTSPDGSDDSKLAALVALLFRIVAPASPEQSPLAPHPPFELIVVVIELLTNILVSVLPGVSGHSHEQTWPQATLRALFLHVAARVSQPAQASRLKRLLKCSVDLCTTYPLQLVSTSLQLALFLAPHASPANLSLLLQACTATLKVRHARATTAQMHAFLRDALANGSAAAHFYGLARLLLISSSAWQFDTSSEVRSDITATILQHLPEDSSANMWPFYVLAKAALQNGHFELSSALLPRLLERTASEHTALWISGLLELSASESLIANASSLPDTGSSQTQQLSQALASLRQAAAKFTAASSPKFSWSLQLQLLQLRITHVEIFSSIASLLRRTQLCVEAEKLSASVAHSVVATQTALVNLENAYERLCRTAIDMDAQSLSIISTQTALCAILRQALGSLQASGGCETDMETNQPPSRDSTEVYSIVDSAVAQLPAATDSLGERLEAVTEIFRRYALGARVPILPVFFASQKLTRIEMTVSPSPSPTESTVTTKQSDLLLRVEGVVQQHVSAPHQIRHLVVTFTCTSIEGDGEAAMPLLPFRAADELVTTLRNAQDPLISNTSFDNPIALLSARTSVLRTAYEATPSTQDGYFAVTIPVRYTQLARLSTSAGAQCTRHVSIDIVARDADDVTWDVGLRSAFLLKFEL